MKNIIYLLIFITSNLLVGCEKLVRVDPPNNALVSQNVWVNDNTAIAFVNGIYTTMTTESKSLLSMMAGLSADELSILDDQISPTLIAFYRNELTSLPDLGNHYWSEFYPLIFSCNVAIEGLSSSSSLNPKIKQQLLGEALFVRAYFYFYLVNLYGDVPLVLTTDYQQNSLIPRTAATKVWEQIVEDLKSAQSLLSTKYLENDLINSTISTQRIRPTSWAATALLARVYLYMGDNVNAELSASSVINNTALYEATSLNEAFLKNSKEAIFQLPPVSSNYNTEEGAYFLILPFGPAPYVGYGCTYINTPLLNSFELGDQRKTAWVNSLNFGGKIYYYPFKYKLGYGSTPGGEYAMILRLGEQYLIRAEARIKQGGGKIADGITDLNVIRTRARETPTVLVPNPLPPLSANLTSDDAIKALAHERQTELFTEWGHRWLDLKRTGKVDEVMTAVCPLKGSVWQSYQQWYPVPNNEILNNPSLVGHQNLGYQ